MDGLVGMQGRGPINGYPINLNVLLASCDPVALDATAMRLIGLEPTTSQHIVQAERISLGYQSESKIEVDGPFADMQTKVEPGVEDWAIRLMNRVARSPFLTKHFLLNDGIFYPVRRVVNLGASRRSTAYAPAFDPLSESRKPWIEPTDRPISAPLTCRCQITMSTFSIAVATILWTCLALIVFSYAIYPLLIWCLSRWFARPVVPPEFEPKDWPSVSLLIAAYNEEEVIEERVRNALAMDYPSDRLEIVIALDGCSDGTASIVRRYQSQGVRLLDFAVRRGKSAVLNNAIDEVRGKIVLLSDANTGIDSQAARRLVRWFGHPQVGAVCGRLVLTDPHTGRNVDSLYWKYETFLKRCEGRLGALLGANGAIYAIRKELYQPIPSQTLIDDFVIPLLAKLRSGCSIVYESSAVAREETPADVRSEFRRRARIGAGGFQSIGMLWKLLDPRQGWVALSFLSHKVLRWLCPFFMIGVLASNLLLLDIPFYRLVLMSQFGFYLLSVLAAFLPSSIKFLKPLRLATMFTSMNLALFVGFWRWLSGRQNGVWIRTSRIAGNQEMSDEPSMFHLSRSN